jgi:hypothetical protein
VDEEEPLTREQRRQRQKRLYQAWTQKDQTGHSGPSMENQSEEKPPPRTIRRPNVARTIRRPNVAADQNAPRRPRRISKA